MSKVVIITGAGKGLGKAMAIGLSRQGYKVVAAARNKDELSELAKRLEGEYLTQVCDITKLDDVQKLVKATNQKFGNIEVLVNNAGVYVGGSLTETDIAVQKQVLDVVVTGTATVTGLVLQTMAKQKSGQIISILDATTEGSTPNFTQDSKYAVDFAAKKAKSEYTNVLRLEAAAYRVKVTSFFLTWVASKMDLDDQSKAPAGATHPSDAVKAILDVLDKKPDKFFLPASK